MKREKIEFLLGLVLIVLPVSGFPNIFRVALSVIIGVSLIYLSTISIKEKAKKVKKTKNHNNSHFEVFVESKPEEKSEKFQGEYIEEDVEKI